MLVVVDEPDCLLGIVGVDHDRVRTLHFRVPLHEVRGLGKQIALAIEQEDVVLPARVDAQLITRALPRLPSFFGELARAAVARRARAGRVAPRQTSDGEEDAWPHVAQLLRHRPLDVRQLAVFDRPDAIGTFGKHARAGAEGPLLVARDRREILWPSLDDLISAEHVLPALLIRDSGDRRDMSLGRDPRAVQHVSRHQTDDAGQQNRYAITHLHSPKKVGGGIIPAGPPRVNLKPQPYPRGFMVRTSSSV